MLLHQNLFQNQQLQMNIQKTKMQIHLCNMKISKNLKSKESHKKQIMKFKVVNDTIQVTNSGKWTCCGICSVQLNQLDNEFLIKNFIKHILKWVPIQEGQVAIYLDNAGIHFDGVEELVTNCGHFIHYAPTYSCELNPIEHYFGYWKGNVDNIRNIEGDGSLFTLLRIICEAFNKITPQEIRKTISYEVIIQLQRYCGVVQYCEIYLKLINISG
ncbi:DDE_superfamily endonuclease domain-containing protein [Hexamita inflata]|uniref:DDE superfamily endonuclease domain-containing protein n=1 Tax=Hexamita inflata TaxID=28002 RepID=A0AA86RPT3_9EUKA|nr:DDE superfamily endonuclease domain-containing protein [Hexamita inflata]